MKIALTTLILCLTLSTSGQKQQPLDKAFKIPNVQPVKGNYLYAAETELSNFQYLEFLYHTKKEKSREFYQSMLPDTLSWRVLLRYGDPVLTEFYLRHPAYQHYPVVGVSKDQAHAYCQWLTGMLNDQFATNDSPVKNVLVRLPTEAEWELAARAGKDDNIIYPWGHNQLQHQHKKYKGSFMACFKINEAKAGQRGADYHGRIGEMMDSQDVTAPIISYWPNDFGLYNMGGNVAEMVSDKPVTKGGSWFQEAESCKITASEDYLDRAAHIGFRYFVEVLELKEDRPKKEQTLHVKEIDKSVAPLSESLMIGKYEVSNRLFNFQFDITKDPWANWNILPTNWAPYTSDRTQKEYRYHSRFDHYPVVFISHDDAMKYCSWLTDFYNQSEGRKYKKVKFRLPTEKEWEAAASGNETNRPYPWGGPYVRNSKGEFLCNFFPLNKTEDLKNEEGKTLIKSLEDEEELRSMDGGDLTLPVNSYFPNAIGLFNCSGNAAEMVAEPGISKGGSWNSPGPYIQIETSEKYSKNNPMTGFRYVMEIIEE